MLTSPPSFEFLRAPRAESTCLELGGGFASLRAVGLVGDYREVFSLGSRQFLRTAFQGERKRLDGADYDFLVTAFRAAWPVRRFCCCSRSLMVATTPVVRSKSKMASCNCVHRSRCDRTRPGPWNRTAFLFSALVQI